MDREFYAADGKIYTITIDDEGEDISVTRDGKNLGKIRLEYREDGDGSAYYHITHLALEACKRLGIGQRCLEIHKEAFCEPLTAGTSALGQFDDGSHLTGDGPAFIAKMRKKGIVAPSTAVNLTTADDEDWD
ncbi:hypothetical protein [Pseudomonas sp. MWU12-2345]|uniref:hypothetical protein n=1 Tax=Pseudomonas sp. MWU12-2345 TaxID=2928689 RepID=UPI00200E0862|nr:hypothetical protein [Pseudomonas sp. MWU12-2345]